MQLFKPHALKGCFIRTLDEGSEQAEYGDSKSQYPIFTSQTILEIVIKKLLCRGNSVAILNCIL